MDAAHAPAWQMAHTEDILTFVRIAEGLRIRCNLHPDYRSFSADLASLWLLTHQGVIHETI